MSDVLLRGGGSQISRGRTGDYNRIRLFGLNPFTEFDLVQHRFNFMDRNARLHSPTDYRLSTTTLGSKLLKYFVSSHCGLRGMGRGGVKEALRKDSDERQFCQCFKARRRARDPKSVVLRGITPQKAIIGIS